MRKMGSSGEGFSGKKTEKMRGSGSVLGGDSRCWLQIGLRGITS